MEIKMKIYGMSCEGCEKRIENVLKSIPEIKTVRADYKNKMVSIISSKEIPEDLIIKKIEDLDFKVGN